MAFKSDGELITPSLVHKQAHRASLHKAVRAVQHPNDSLVGFCFSSEFLF